MKIHIFYHLWCTEFSIEVFIDAFNKIKESELYDNIVTLHVNLTGPYSNQVKVNSIFNDPKISVTNLQIDSSSEVDTLNLLKSKCRELKDIYVLYLHSKGASKRGNATVEAWKNYMEYFNIERWEDCINKLHKESYNTCGVNLQSEPKLHYSGNFWWATAEYINTLNEVPYNNRLYCEMWLLDTINPKSYSLHNSGINHYNECYLESEYK
tara:strand:+ start:352 stop:981 length:630 start_codon:yes stop_codon:yes gene_type:complete